MALTETSLVDIELRSYAARGPADRHGFAQLVLPVAGELQLEVAGMQKPLDPLYGAVVLAGAWHSQYGSVANRSLIIDIDHTLITQGHWQRLSDQPFTAISAAARKLIQFMQISLDAGTVQTSLVRAWAPLLLDTLALGAPQMQSRLTALLAQVEAQPALPWNTETMAQCAHMSVSRLHALFRAELDTTPRAWLLRTRLECACELLAQSQRTIADVALGTGFSDQTALTRAMRDNLDTTPAAYRRQRQEIASISQ